MTEIVIVGNDLAAWWAAAELAEVLPEQTDIVFVEPKSQPGDDSPVYGFADSTLPGVALTTDLIGLNETQLVLETGGCFSLGTAVSGWTDTDNAFFIPWSDYGQPAGTIPFSQLASRLHSEGADIRLANFSLAAMAAQANRFSPHPALDYGLHLDVMKLTSLMQHKSLQSGVRQSAGKLQRPAVDESGRIQRLETDQGELVEADWYIDASRGGILGMPGSPDWIDWSPWLPCDRVMTAGASTPLAPPPYTHVQAFEAGWIRHLPLPGRFSFNATYSSSQLDDGAVSERLHQMSGSQGLQCHVKPVNFGRLRMPWRENVLTIGNAAAFIDPLVISNLQLLRADLQRMCNLLPASCGTGIETKEYNRQAAAYLNNARDLSALQYHLNGRVGDAFWDAAREATLPDSAAYKLELYSQLGRVALYDEEPVNEGCWIALMNECGVQPFEYAAVADSATTQVLEAHARQVRDEFMNIVRDMPQHAEYLAGLQNIRKAE